MYLKDENLIWIGKGDEKIYLLPQMANRHGLITGATGTGKTITLKVLAEAFSDMGVPVFLADIKGDVSGTCMPGEPNKNVDGRVQQLGIDAFSYKAFPVRFFDIYGEKGIPVRTTISDMGPTLLARILGLNDTQEGVLSIIFKIADDSGLLLIDIKDLQAMLQYAADNKDRFQTAYGNIATQTVGAIQRALVNLQTSGGDIFFGEPALDIKDWIVQDDMGHGIINLLYCVKLINSPQLYSTFLLWMLSELYETLPEAGDLTKPKMVFFFDEAHLLFNEAPKALLQKVEQVARLIRSKGVGIYFITQSPGDIPDTVLAQLGNKIQHALRAYTPKEQKVVRAAAQSFRANPAFDTETVISELGTGEALISTLDAKGAPNIVQRAFVLPPQSYMGVAPEELIRQRISYNPLFMKYGTPIDRHSAFEELGQRTAQEKEDAETAKQKAAEDAQRAKEEAKAQREREKEEARLAREREKEEARRQREQEKQAKLASTMMTRVLTNAASSVGRSLGTQLLRGLLGTRKK